MAPSAFHGHLPFIIGVSGGTASGKSLVIEKIMSRLASTETKKKQLITIPLESFYKELSTEDRKRVALGEYDFDHPSVFDFDLLLSTIESLEKGDSVNIPKYDFIENARKGSMRVDPADVIIVEGILIFYDERIRNKFAMKLFVDADADIRLARRVRRDTVERQRELKTVLTQYTKKVKPAFEEFCQPTKKYADVIIPRGGENDVAIDLLVQHIQFLKEFEEEFAYVAYSQQEHPTFGMNNYERDLLKTPRGSPELESNGLHEDGDSKNQRVLARPH